MVSSVIIIIFGKLAVCFVGMYVGVAGFTFSESGEGVGLLLQVLYILTEPFVIIS